MDTTQLMTSLASLQAGALHPLLGLDHLLALLGMGMLYKNSSNTMKYASLLFVPMMLLAAILGLHGAGLPEMETGITLSLIILGAVLMQNAKIPNVIKAPLVLGFAMYHGLAHGLEMPHAAQPAFYLLGMVLTSALLQALGAKLQDVLLGFKTRQPESKAGAVLALVGAYLFA
ncbi:MAG: HupE/UreJ family protein [Limnobacter sp.]|nr:HupE/UreJ family protein [Limnobacter sp.]